jgi:hypothetical protein
MLMWTDSIVPSSRNTMDSINKAPEHEITELLQAWRPGDESALEKLTPAAVSTISLE